MKKHGVFVDEYIFKMKYLAGKLIAVGDCVFKIKNKNGGDILAGLGSTIKPISRL